MTELWTATKKNNYSAAHAPAVMNVELLKCQYKETWETTVHQWHVLLMTQHLPVSRWTVSEALHALPHSSSLIITSLLLECCFPWKSNTLSLSVARNSYSTAEMENKQKSKYNACVCVVKHKPLQCIYIRCNNITKSNSISGSHVVGQVYTLYVLKSEVGCQMLIDSDILYKWSMMASATFEYTLCPGKKREKCFL